jgi:hypothetical protein
MLDKTNEGNNVKKVTIDKYKDFRLQYVHEIEDLVNMYYHDIHEDDSCELSKLSPIDILAGLELIKLRFYCKVTREGFNRRILREEKKNEK